MMTELIAKDIIWILMLFNFIYRLTSTQALHLFKKIEISWLTRWRGFKLFPDYRFKMGQCWPLDTNARCVLCFAISICIFVSIFMLFFRPILFCSLFICCFELELNGSRPMCDNYFEHVNLLTTNQASYM